MALFLAVDKVDEKYTDEEGKPRGSYIEKVDLSPLAAWLYA